MVFHSLDDESHVASCTLCRTEKLAKQTLHHALSRQVKWPTNKHSKPVLENSSKAVTLDEAFSSIFHFMKVTCSNCKKYYRGCRQCNQIPDDLKHCDRFHKNHNNALQSVSDNAMMNTQSLKIIADPGTYSVTTGVWGKEIQQTHVVKIDRGQLVSMDFIV